MFNHFLALTIVSLFISSPSFNTFAAPADRNPDDVIFTVTGSNDCSVSGYECSSINQALTRAETIAAPSTIVKLATDIADQSERQTIITFPVDLSGVDKPVVSITDHTTPTTNFFYVSNPSTDSEIIASVENINFYITASGGAAGTVSGSIFKLDTSVGPISLTVTSVVIALSPTATGTSAETMAPIISASGATLTLDSVTVSSITVTEGSFLTMDGGSVVLQNNCEFTNLVGQGTDPTDSGFFSGTLRSGKQITFNGVSFKSCTSAGNGGVLNILSEADATATVSIGSMLYSQSAMFTSCSAAQNGGVMYMALKGTSDFPVLKFDRIKYTTCSAQGAANYIFFTFPEAEHTQMQDYLDTYMQLVYLGQSLDEGNFMFTTTTDPDPVEMVLALEENTLNVTLTPSATAAQCVANKGKCATLEEALALSVGPNKVSNILNVITIAAGTTLVATSFTGVVEQHMTLAGNGNTVTLPLTTVISAPLITTGGPNTEGEISVIVTDLTITVERTDKVFLREHLFKHSPGFTDSMILTLSNVAFTSGNAATNGVPAPAYSTYAIIQCTTNAVKLMNVKFSYFHILSTQTADGQTLCDPLIDGSNGLLLIQTSSFTSITLDAAPLLGINPVPQLFGIEAPTGATLAKSVTIFKSITRASGNGGVISAVLSAPIFSVDLAWAEFDTCVCSGGTGGACYFSGVTSPSQLTFGSNLFFGCQATTGHKIFIAGTGFEHAEAALAWEVLEEDYSMNTDVCLQLDGTTLPLFDHSAVVDTLIVDAVLGDDSASTLGNCGVAVTHPCKTLYTAYKLRTPHTTRIVLAPGTYTAETRPLTFTQEIQFIGGADEPDFTIKAVNSLPEGLFIISPLLPSGDLYFTNFGFSLSSTGLTSCVFTSSSEATLHITNIAFLLLQASAVPLSAALIQASAGAVILTSVYMNGIRMASGHSVIDTSGATLSLETCTFMRITTATRPMIALGPRADQLELGPNNGMNTFMTVTRESGNGAIFEVTVGGEGNGINLKYMTCIDCLCTEQTVIPYSGQLAYTAYAGAIYIRITDNLGTFTVTPTAVFMLRGASATRPYQSAITLASSDGAYFGDTESGYVSAIVNADPTWRTNTQKYQIFILDARTGRTTANNTLLYAMTNNVVGTETCTVATNGGDVPGCGLSGVDDIPCFSIQTAFLNLDLSQSTHTVEVAAGTFGTAPFSNAWLTIPVTVSGQVSRGLHMTFATLSTPSFITSSDTDPVTIQQMTITTTSGGFVTNTGSGGVYLYRLHINGIPSATAPDRVYSTLITSTVGDITLNDVRMANITLVNVTCMVISGGALIVQNCSFSRIIGRSPGSGGGVIQFTVTTSTPLTVTDTTFDTCHTQRSGGCLALTLQSAGNIKFGDIDEPVVFKDNTAVNYGGAIFFNSSSPPTSITFTEVAFEGAAEDEGTAYAGKSGNYMYYQSNSPNADLDYTAVADVIIQYLITHNDFMVRHSHLATAINMYELQSYIHVGGGKADSIQTSCGTSAIPCNTIYDAVHSKTYASDITLFRFACTNVPASTRTVTIKNTLLFVGENEGDDIPVVNVSTILNSDTGSEELPPLIDIAPTTSCEFNVTDIIFKVAPLSGSTGTLENAFIRAVHGAYITLDYVYFETFEDTQVTLQTSLLNADEATLLQFFDVHFVGITLQDAPLLRLPLQIGTLFAVRDVSTFESITRIKGDGAVLQHTIVEGDGFECSNVVFRNCCCLDGHGGAVAFTYTSGSFVLGDTEDEDTGECHPTSFINCSSSLPGGALYFEFTENVAPSTSPLDDNCFILQNIDLQFTPPFTLTHGKYVYVVGKYNVANEITLWKDLLHKERIDNGYEYEITEGLPDGEEAVKDVLDLVPDEIVVTTETTDVSDTCIECLTIIAALKTYASFATHITLNFDSRACVMNTVIDHTVTLLGIRPHVIVPSKHATDSAYIVATGKRKEIVCEHFSIDIDSSDQTSPVDVHAIVVENGALFTLDTMAFTALHPDRVITASLIDAQDGTLTITNSAFSLMTLHNCPLLEPAAITGRFQIINDTLFNTVHESSTSTATGTILSLELQDGNGISLANCKFASCNTSATGALIWIELLDVPDDDALKFENLFFSDMITEETTSQSILSNAVTRYFVMVTTLTDYIQAAGFLWTELMNHHTYPANSFMWYYNTLGSYSSDLATLRSTEYYVNPSSTTDDSTQCPESAQCPYLHYAADLANKANIEEVTIQVEAGTLSNSQFKAVFLRSCSVEGYVSDAGIETLIDFEREGTGSLALVSIGVSPSRNQDVEVTFTNIIMHVKSTHTSPIYVSAFGVVSQYDHTACLTLNTFTFALSNSFTPHETHSALETTLINAQSGVLKLISCTFSNLIFASDPVFTVTPRTTSSSLTDIILQGSNVFTNITRQGGNGSVFDITLKEGSVITFCNASFNTCGAPIGGAIYLSIPASATGAEFNFDRSSITFSAAGTIEDGAYVYIRAESTRFIDEEYQAKYQVLVDPETDAKHTFVIEIDLNGSSVQYQMYEFLGGSVKVTDELCTDCYSDVTMGILAFNKDLTKKRIVLAKDLTYQPPSEIPVVRFLSLTAIKPDRTKAVVPVTGIKNYLYLITSLTGATIKACGNDVQFVISSTAEHQVTGPLFIVYHAAASMTVSACSVNRSTEAGQLPLSAPLIMANAGSIGLNNVHLYNLVFYSMPAISPPPNLENLHFYVASSFHNITRMTGSGAVMSLSVEASDTLNLKCLSFENCHCLNGHGGAISLALHFRASVILTQVAFTSCSVTQTSSGATQRANDNNETSFTSSSLSAYSPLHHTHTHTHLTNDNGFNGGGLYINIEGTPDVMTFTDVSFSGCQAAQGHALYLDCTEISAPTEEYWRNLLQEVTGAEEKDLIALVTSNGSTQAVDLYSYTKPKETQQQTTEESSSGAKSWIIILIVALTVTALAIVSLLIFCCCRKKN